MGFQVFAQRFGVLRWLWSCWKNMSGEGWVSPSFQSGMSPVLSIPQKPGMGGWTGPTRPLPTSVPMDDPRGCGVASSHPKGFEARGSTRPSHPACSWVDTSHPQLPSFIPTLSMPEGFPAGHATARQPKVAGRDRPQTPQDSIHNLHTFIRLHPQPPHVPAAAGLITEEKTNTLSLTSRPRPPAISRALCCGKQCLVVFKECG